MTSYTLILALLAFAHGQLNLPNCPVAPEAGVIAPPVLGSPDIATLVSDDFTVNWIWSVTQTRDTTPSFKFGTCTAVSAPTTSTETSDCSLTQSATVSWATLPGCGWTSQLSAGIRRYTGSMFLIATETFIDARGATQTRDLTYEFALAVDFPEEAIISSQITAFAPILVNYFVLSQAYDRPSNTGILNFRTQVQYPWKIDLTPPVTVDGTTNTATFTAGAETIATQVGDISTQNWVLTIAPDTSVCVLDGTYTIPAEVVCTLANQSDCPALSTVPTFDLVLNTLSENFCASTGLDISIVGTLDVYSDDTYALASRKQDFELGATSFYKLTVTSPAATIANIDIEQVTLSTATPGINALLASGGATDSWIIFATDIWVTQIEDTTLGTATDNDGIQTFTFTLTQDSVDIPRDSALDLVVTARAEVTFLGNEGGKKRTTMATFQISTQRQAYATQVSFKNDASSFTGPSFLMVLCFLSALVCFY